MCMFIFWITESRRCQEDEENKENKMLFLEGAGRKYRAVNQFLVTVFVFIVSKHLLSSFFLFNQSISVLQGICESSIIFSSRCEIFRMTYNHDKRDLGIRF